MKRFLLPILILANCPDQFPNPFAEQTKLDPCDPTSSIYQDNRHYIDADFVKEDGTLDYERVMNSRKIESSPCDPLKNAKPMAETTPETKAQKAR